MNPIQLRPAVASVLAAASLLTIGASPLASQDRLKAMPGYDQFQKVSRQIPQSFRTGAINASWASDSKTFDFSRDGKRWRYDIASKRAEEIAATATTPGGRGFGGPARGRQVAQAFSPDSSLRAFYRDRNLYIADAKGGGEQRLTTDGSESERVKYGTASWVYGEELRQNTAMWWSPDGKRLAYYRFDEKPVKDYFLAMDQTKVQAALDVEAYPKAGADNPIVDVYVYDVESRRTTKLDVRDGKPFTNDVVGHYVYAVRWSPDGKELLFNRTNRRQNVMELTACSPSAGNCRVVIREEWPSSWTDNHPTMTYLADNNRFIWSSERSGFRNYYLYDLNGKLITQLTKHPFEVGQVVKVDEKSNALFYMARSGDNHMKLQLHRASLDGKTDKRLTDPAFLHTVSLSPDGRHFVDVAQTHDSPPVSRLLDVNGKLVSEIATSDLSRFDELKLQKVELYTFKAADGVTELHGMLHKPSNFDPARKYPVIVSVYGGPNSNGARETFTLPNALTEYGFVVLQLDSRSAGGRGKKFTDAIYMKLGIVEIDDQAAGVKALYDRPYIDKQNVGIYGTSYGGYASAMALLRHPDVFTAAAASSSVTDWRHYDSIYTERYMWIPQENASGYDMGSAMQYAPALKGRLMLYYGTADNNVHPSNTMQLITALQRAGKSFEVQVGPDAGHTGINSERMMEFFIENLVMKKSSTAM